MPDAVRGLASARLGLRERERGVVQGYSNKEIATQLILSVKTVETYRARALEKLGLTSRAALVRYALERGWLQPPPDPGAPDASARVSLRRCAMPRVRLGHRAGGRR